MDVENTDIQTTETQPDISTAPVTETESSSQAPVKTLDDIQKLADGADALTSLKAPTGAPGALDAAQPAVPEFKPDFKYKVYGQEKVLDPRLQALVKTKEDQEYITKIMSKADGIDGVLQQRDLYRQNYQNIEKQGQAVLSAMDKGDYGSMFKALGYEKPSLEQLVQGLKISDDDLIRYAYQRASLTDEQKGHYDLKQQLESQNRDYQMQLQQIQADHEKFQVNQRENELQGALSTPEVSPIVQAFDQTHGPGAFWEEVRLRGIAHFNLNKVDAPVSQMVKEVAARLSPYARAQTAPTQMMQAHQAQPSPQAQSVSSRAPQAVPVIPVVPAGGTSPAKKAIRSVKDLENLWNEME